MPAYDPIRDSYGPPLVSPGSPSKLSLSSLVDGPVKSPIGSPAALERSLSASSFGRPASANSDGLQSPLFPFQPPPDGRPSPSLADATRRSASPLRVSVGAPAEPHPSTSHDLARAVFPNGDEAGWEAVTSIKASSAPMRPSASTEGRTTAAVESRGAAKEAILMFQPKAAQRSTMRTDASSSTLPASTTPAKVMTIPLPSPSRKIPPAPPSQPVGVPYAPRRITTAFSVLQPLSTEQLDALRAAHLNPLRTGASNPPPDTGEPSAFAVSTITNAGASSFLNGSAGVTKKRPAQEMMGDVREVADHYNKRQNTGIHERNKSPIIGLRNFNNWIKSVLIDRYARQPAIPQGQPRKPLKVLDMGCGKGGDLRKWVIAGVDQYIGLDIADVSVEQAAGRWSELSASKRFPARFVAMDCFTDSIANHLDPAALERPFDTVSMQFCMHYAFQSIAKARVMLENVTRYLRPGGVFLGTIPDSSFLLSELVDLPEGERAFGNDIYKITFDERGDEIPLYGCRYSFFLQDAVDNVPEYVVHWDHFVELAGEYGLQLAFHSTFPELFGDAQDEPEYKAMLTRMGVVNEEGESELTQEQWEACSLYVAFAFVKAE